ncbi:hypothetical protein SBRCBS47491_006964 [Sporothrix bragantina]|uniref:Uncharacterized protein n=1 Tax=Sporothrix bragantina TaxID=671064 RepID=A0ABP0C9A3_9PEZI
MPDHEEEQLPSYEPPEEIPPVYEEATDTAAIATNASASSVPPEKHSDTKTASEPYRVSTSMLDVGPSTPYRVHTSMLDVKDLSGNGAGCGETPEADDVVKHTFVADPAEILPPTVLILDGQVIYAENSAPNLVLYQVDRGLTTLGPATKRVQLQRLDRRTLMNGTVRERERDLYTLGHLRELVMPSFISGIGDWPRFYLHAQSSRIAPLGHWGVREVNSDSWELFNTVFEDGHIRYTDKDKKQPLFRCRYNKTGVCTWTDAEKKEVAMMYETASAESTKTPRLIITAPLWRDHRDLLVGMWCCYVWEQALRRHVEVPVPRGKNPYKLSRVFN